MTRVIGTVRAVTNFAASEQGLTLNNPVAGVYYDRSAGVSDRNAIAADVVRSIQSKCYEVDDDLRWLVALVSDTGMRLAEAAGLTRDDIVRGDDGSLVARVRPHPWRRLKTKGSERDVPLEGAAKWAAERVLGQNTGSEFAFPRYNKSTSTNASAASAALNKWMKEHVPAGNTLHGFRHSMRDRLRAVECPADVVDHMVPVDGSWRMLIPLVLLELPADAVPVGGTQPHLLGTKA